MLAYKNRLIKKKDFEAAYAKGRFFSEGNIALKAANNEMVETRVGFSIGMKFSKNAPARNAAKRQLREIFKKKLPNIKKGLDIVVMIKRAAGEKIVFNKLERDADAVLEKSGLIKNKT